jgi:hypothetical protein
MMASHQDLQAECRWPTLSSVIEPLDFLQRPASAYLRVGGKNPAPPSFISAAPDDRIQR